MDEPTTRPATPPVCARNPFAPDRRGDGRGWKADWAGGHDDQPLQLVVLCPTCWEMEFGASAGHMNRPGFERDRSNRIGCCDGLN